VPIEKAQAGLFNPSEAEALHIVSMGLDQIGRGNIPEGSFATMTVETETIKVKFAFDPKNVPAADAITPDTYKAATQDPGLSAVVSALSHNYVRTNKDILRPNLKLSVTRVDQGSLNFQFVDKAGKPAMLTMEIMPLQPPAMK
jgi:hypothetical protein